MLRSMESAFNANDLVVVGVGAIAHGMCERLDQTKKPEESPCRHPVIDSTGVGIEIGQLYLLV
jgi:hypothetical protein